jgi:hypothetical protein
MGSFRLAESELFVVFRSDFVFVLRERGENKTNRDQR